MKLLLTALFLIITVTAKGQNSDQQRTNYWYFGASAGLDFSSGTAVADTNGKMNVLEGCATMSDQNGNLLMYTDGKTVWNAAHENMENGTDIGVGYYGSPRDGTIIIPKPFDNNIYYIFTVDGWENQFERGMRYTTVDMSYNGGLGKVIEKNKLLFSPVSEQLAATTDGDDCGYWVVSHERSNANWRAYHVTSSGVDTVAVISAAGQDYGVMQQEYILNGGWSLRFSPNGQRVITVNAWNYSITNRSEQIQLLDFNKNTGVFTHIMSMPVDTSIGGYAFSPDNSKVYLETGYVRGKTRQYDISVNDSLTILSSEFLVYTCPKWGISQDMKIGKDQKLYLCAEVVVSDSLSTIENPNASGEDCNFQRASVWLQGKQPTQSLPNFVSSFPVDSPIACKADGVESIPGRAVILSPNPANDFVSVELTTSSWPLQYEIYNAAGNKVMYGSISRSRHEINVSTLSEGIYLFQCFDNQHRFYTQKIIITR
jgi:hypothetical protein